MKRTNNRYRSSRQSVIESRIMSPRILWLGCLSCLKFILKLSFLIAILGGAGWGLWIGFQKAFYQNQDFQLQRIDLNPNGIINEAEAAQAARIDLAAAPNLFTIDIDQAKRNLEQLPGVTRARVERHLPSTLLIRVKTRQPKAWLQHSNAPFAKAPNALLVDDQNVAYPCTERQFLTATNFPVILLSPSAEFPITSGQKILHPELAHCLLLLNSAFTCDSQAHLWMASVRKKNNWSLEMITPDGTIATFGLGDHKRQIENFRAALDHAAQRGYAIKTINLIPKYNIPISIREGQTQPKTAPLPPTEHTAPSTPSAPTESNRRSRDLNQLLNRN